MLRVGRDEARRIAVRAELLDAARSESLVGSVDDLTLLQVDRVRDPHCAVYSTSRSILPDSAGLALGQRPPTLARARNRTRTWLNRLRGDDGGASFKIWKQ